MDNIDFTPKKSAEFINLPNIIKGKVGSGGLSEDILAKAQKLLDEHKMDFTPAAQGYLDTLQQAMDVVRSGDGYDTEVILNQMIMPCVELQSHGTMFHFDLVSTISKHMIVFLKAVDEPDDEVLEILGAFHSTIRAIVLSKIYGDGGESGTALLTSLVDACERYLKQRP